jgi:hypothetical protein
MWLAVLTSLMCIGCPPVTVGNFNDELTCLKWLTGEKWANPELRGKCVKRKKSYPIDEPHRG